MVGRFIGSWLLTKLRTSTVLGTAAVVACGLVVTSILTHGHTAMWAILAVGLFNSVMFPSIFTVGLSGLGPLTSKGSSLMVAAIVGGALIPLAEGHLADAIGVQHAFVIPAVCYIYIALFGYLGGRQGGAGGWVGGLGPPGPASLCGTDALHGEMGVHALVSLFFFEDEVGCSGAGGEFDPVGEVGGDVGDVAGVEDYFFAAFDAGAASFSGGGGVSCLHGAAGDEGESALEDDHLVGPVVVEFGVAGVDADDEEGFVGAEVVEGVEGVAAGAGFGGGEEFGFALLEVGGGVDEGVGGLGEEWGGC